MLFGPIFPYGGSLLIYNNGGRRGRRRLWYRFFDCLGTLVVGCGLGAFLLPIYRQDDCDNDSKNYAPHEDTVPREIRTLPDYANDSQFKTAVESYSFTPALSKPRLCDWFCVSSYAGPR